MLRTAGPWPWSVCEASGQSPFTLALRVSLAVLALTVVLVFKTNVLFVCLIITQWAFHVALYWLYISIVNNNFMATFATVKHSNVLAR